MTAARWEDYFVPGERLLWEGAPEPGFHDWPKFLAVSVFGIPFLVAGLGLTFGGLWGALTAEGWKAAGGALLLGIFGMPFLGGGLFMVFGFWALAHAAPNRIRYALSTRAAYVARRFWLREIKIYPITRDTALELSSRRGTSTVTFYSHREADSDGPTVEKAAFEHIADGAEVLRLMRVLQAEQA